MSACSILLVSANRHTSPYPVYPLGLSYLKTYLERTISGIRVDMADCNLLTDGQLAERIRMLAPRYIGLSLRNVDGANSLDRRGFLPQYKALVDVIRAASDAPLIIGGAGFSIYPEAFMRELGADYGIILLDLPPVTAVTDGLVISKLVDGMIVVVCRGYCEKKLLEAALRNMKYLNIKILGFVMTRGSVDKSGYGKRYGKYKKGYGGYYSYGAPPAGDRRPSEPKQTGGKKLS